MTNVGRVPYDEFSMFHENAAEYGLPYDGPPTVRREAVEVEPGRSLSTLVWLVEHLLLKRYEPK